MSDTARAPAEGVDDSPRETRTRRRLGWATFTVILLALGWLAAVGNAALSAQAELREGRAAMVHGREQLVAGQIATAASDFRLAEEQFASAARRLDSLHVRMARPLPGFGTDLRAAAGIARGGELTARAGREVTGGLQALPGGTAALAPRNGAIPLDAVAAMSDPLARARDLIAQAEAAVASTPAQGLIGPVQRARTELLDRLGEARPAAEAAAALADALPSFLGAETPKRYFFGSTNPAELRGTGGFLGAFAILTVDNGRLDFGEFTPIQDLPELSLSDVEPPSADFAARYNRFGGAAKWMNINMTPDFPSAALALLRAYEAGMTDRLDGVVFADPQAFAALLKVAGPTQVPDVGTINANNVVGFLANEAYVKFDDNDVRKRVLGAVAAATLEGFLQEGGSGDPIRTVRALGDAAADGHLLLYSAEPAVQEAFQTVGVAGQLLDPDGDFLAVVVNNAANNKADFYTDRGVRYEVSIHPDGAAQAVAEVELVNHTPVSGLPKRVIGSNRRDELDPGDNLSIVSVYCAGTCEVDAFDRSDGSSDDAFLEYELGHPVLMAQVRLPSGSAERLKAGWTVSEAWSREGDGGRYRFTFQGQTTIRPTTLDLVVHPPIGAEVVSHSPGMEVDGGAVTWSGEAAGVATFEVAWAPPPAEGLSARLRGLLGMTGP